MFYFDSYLLGWLGLISAIDLVQAVNERYVYISFLFLASSSELTSWIFRQVFCLPYSCPTVLFSGGIKAKSKASHRRKQGKGCKWLIAAGLLLLLVFFLNPLSALSIFPVSTSTWFIFPYPYWSFLMLPPPKKVPPSFSIARHFNSYTPFTYKLKCFKFSFIVGNKNFNTLAYIHTLLMLSPPPPNEPIWFANWQAG